MTNLTLCLVKCQVSTTLGVNAHARLQLGRSATFISGEKKKSSLESRLDRHHCGSVPCGERVSARICDHDFPVVNPIDYPLY
jgi:hypothetical protein